MKATSKLILKFKTHPTSLWYLSKHIGEVLPNRVPSPKYTSVWNHPIPQMLYNRNSDFFFSMIDFLFFFFFCCCYLEVKLEAPPSPFNPLPLEPIPRSVINFQNLIIHQIPDTAFTRKLQKFFPSVVQMAIVWWVHGHSINTTFHQFAITTYILHAVTSLVDGTFHFGSLYKRTVSLSSLHRYVHHHHSSKDPFIHFLNEILNHIQ